MPRAAKLRIAALCGMTALVACGTLVLAQESQPRTRGDAPSRQATQPPVELTPMSEPPRFEREAHVKRLARDAVRKRIELHLEKIARAQLVLRAALLELQTDASLEQVLSSLADSGIPELDPKHGHDAQFWNQHARGEGQRAGPREPRDPNQNQSGSQDAQEPVTALQRQAVLEILDILKPQIATDLRALEVQDETAAHERFAKLAGDLSPVIVIKQTDPILYRIRLNELTLKRDAAIKAFELSKALQSGADADALALLRSELTDLIAQQHQVRKESQLHELQKLESQIARIKSSIEDSNDADDATLQAEVDALIERANSRRRRSHRGDSERRESDRRDASPREPGRRERPQRDR